MSLNVGPYVNALADIASTSGLFDAVLKHEPKHAPDINNLTGCVIGTSIVGIQSSGLNALSARVEFRVRILSGMLTEPQDVIDTVLMNAAGAYMGELIEAYTLGGTVRDVDLLGADGEPLRAELGYMSIGGGQGGSGTSIFRVADVVVPIIINDCWEMAA